MNWKFWQKKDKDKDKDNKVEEQPIVIPEPINEVVEFRENIANHDKFNVLLDVDGTMFRIKSEQSHEVVRLVCKCYGRKIKDRTIKSINIDGFVTLYYAHSITESSFVKRLFITDNGNFFYQNIYANGDVKYFKIDRYDIHKDMSIWENPNRREINLSNSNSYIYCHYLVQPGTYASSKEVIESGKTTCDLETFFDSYEIIDQERYDKLIEVL